AAARGPGSRWPACRARRGRAEWRTAGGVAVTLFVAPQTLELTGSAGCRPDAETSRHAVLATAVPAAGLPARGLGPALLARPPGGAHRRRQRRPHLARRGAAGGLRPRHRRRP